MAVYLTIEYTRNRMQKPTIKIKSHIDIYDKYEYMYACMHISEYRGAFLFQCYTQLGLYPNCMHP
jgi:hypothetical protein